MFLSKGINQRLSIGRMGALWLGTSGISSFADYTYIPHYGQSLSLGTDPNVSEIVSLGASKTITGITQANPVVVTATGHGFTDGDVVYIDSVVGTTQVNNHSYEVTGSTENTFQLYEHDGETPSVTALDGTAHTAYTSGGAAAISGESATHLMFNGGFRPHYDDPHVLNVNGSAYPQPMTSLIPLAARMDHGDSDYGETLAVGLAQAFSHTVIQATMARGAYKVADLGRADLEGHLHYSNMIRAVRQARVLADAASKSFAIGPLIWKQGEADGNGGTTKAAWKTAVETLRADLERSFRTASKLTSLTLPLIADQQGFAQSGLTYGDIAVGLIELHRDNANITCVGPAYWHDNYTAINDVHMTATGYRVTGELFGLAAEAVNSGTGWKPCHIDTQPTRSGTTITVPIHVPSGALVKDTTLVATVSDDGFTYSGAGITSVTISNDGSTDTNGVITIELDAAAGGTLGYAYENGLNLRIGATYGPRGNIRDSSSAVATHNSDNLYNWLCVDQWVVA